MDKQLLVLVFVPIRGGTGEDGLIGTGYPVGLDLVLTAGHLFRPAPPDARDPDRPVRVRWHYCRGHPDADAEGWIEIPQDAIVPPADPALDALLLRCRHPDQARRWGALSNGVPAVAGVWESYGFPKASVYDGRREARGFGGVCRAFLLQDEVFEVIEEAPPEGEDDWRGASGMPIFVGGQIVGVAKQVPKHFGSKRLDATPAHRILADARLRELLDPDARKARCERLCASLAAHLNERSSKALRDALGGPAAAADQNGQLAECFLNADVRHAIEALHRAHRRLVAEGAAADTAPLVTAARWVVPALFDQSLIRTARGRLDGLALVPLPAGTYTVAELIMAGVDERDARFRPRTREVPYPPGEFCLPQPPEGGIAGNSSDDLARHLLRKFDPGADAIRGLRTAIDAYLVAAFDPSTAGAPQRSPEERIRSASRLLQAQRKYDEKTLYMIFFRPEDPVALASMEALVEGLKRDYPALAFLALDPAQRQEFADRDLIDPFCRMLSA